MTKIEFAELYKENESYFYGVAFNRCKDRDMVNEILQESALKALSNLEKYEHRGKFRNWFNIILRNTHLDLVKLRKKSPQPLFGLYLDTQPTESREQIEDRKKSLEVRKNSLVIEFSEREIKIIELLYQGYIYQDIANMFGITKSCIAAEINRMRKRARANKKLNEIFYE